MADDELLVTISGPAFSLLLYENRRIMDQIGFLLGEILMYVTKKVTDVDRDIEHTKYHIDIKSIVAYPIGEPFFNSIGQIDRNKLESVLGEHIKHVVGWYHFREEFPTMTPSFRDKNLHTELTQYFTSINSDLLANNFLFCNLTSTISELGGTHKFKHLLLRKQSAVYKPVSLKINNLGADASRPDGSDYKPRPTFSSHYDTFNKVYHNIRKDLKNVSGVEAVTMIQDAADNLLKKLIPKVSKSDQLVSELENQLLSLRDEYFRRKYEQSQLREKMEQMEVDSKSDSNSQPKTPETLELQEIEKSLRSPEPSPSSSSVKTTVKEYENQLRQRSEDSRELRRSLADRDLMLIRDGKDNQSGNLEQTKSKKSTKPVHQFIQDGVTRSKNSQSRMGTSLSPDVNAGDS